jgi:hypothetical protein
LLTVAGAQCKVKKGCEDTDKKQGQLHQNAASTVLDYFSKQFVLKKKLGTGVGDRTIKPISNT